MKFVPRVDMLVEELEGRIESGQYEVGQQLPGEARLSSELGVSRPLVREVLARLRERGYIETLNGRGSFVRPRESMLGALLERIEIDGETTDTADHLYAVRSMVEGETARVAATAASDDDLQALAELVDAMDGDLDDPEAYTVHDTNFHLGIARSTGNPLYLALLTPIIDIVIGGIFDSVSTYRDGIRGGNVGHRKVIEALLARDPQRSEAAMREHLTYSRSTFPEGNLQRMQGKSSGSH